MCCKLVDDESGKIVCRSVIRLVTEPSTANLRIDPIESLPPDAIHSTKPDAMLDELMTIADLNIPLSHLNENDLVDLILVSTKSKTWQDMERSKHTEHQEDLQQRYFYSSQPKLLQQQHQYPTRSKTAVNEAEITIGLVGTTTKFKEFVFFRDKGEKVTTPVFNLFFKTIWGATFRPTRKEDSCNRPIAK